MRSIKHSIPILLERIVLFLEKERLNFSAIFFIIFCLSLFRSWIEAQLFSYTYNIIDYGHTIAFYFLVFVIGLFILKVVTKERLTKIANVICYGFFLLPLPPILDFFILNRTFGYDYMPKGASLDVFLTFTPTESAGIFQILMLLSFLLLACLYVFVKTKSLSKIVITFFSFWVMIVVVSIPYINPLFPPPGKIFQVPFFLYYCLLIIVFLLLIIIVSKKKLLTLLLKSLRPFPILHGVTMVLLGIIVAGNLNTEEFFRYPFTDTFGIVILSILTVVFAWCYTVLINHIFDREIDKKSGEQRVTTENMLTISQIKQLSILFAILSFLFASLLNYEIFILTIIALVLGTLYSVPPFRLRNRIFSSLFIGVGSSIAFFIGTVTPSVSYSKTGLLLLTPTIPFHAFLIGVVICFALSIGTIIKDVKNYEGDKKSGVRNIFTIYGMEKGVSIASVLLFISFLSPLLLFYQMFDFLVIIPFGVVTMLLFKKLKKVEITFILYFIMVVYLLSRWLGFI